MGTRHLIFVTLNKETKIAQYGQWDGYPDGVGLDLLRILRGIDLQKLKEQVAKLQFASRDVLDSVDEDTFAQKHPELSRDTSADIIKMVMEAEKPENLLLVDCSGDKNQGWIAYCWYIDLDEEVFSMDNNRKATFDLNNLPSDEDFLKRCEEAMQ